jgi:hypothetical protein
MQPPTTLLAMRSAKVAQKEPWCEGATAMTDIAVISAEEFGTPGMAGRSPESMMGAVRLLQEGGHQFDVVTAKAILRGTSSLFYRI